MCKDTPLLPSVAICHVSEQPVLLLGSHRVKNSTLNKYIYVYMRDRVSTVVKVLCYKSEGRWFDPSWC